jgi:hypothetical protein
MKKETLACEEPVKIGDLTITPVVRRYVMGLAVKGVPSFMANKEPVYVILENKGQTRAVDMLGRDVPIHQVRSECSAHDFDQAGKPAPPRV